MNDIDNNGYALKTQIDVLYGEALLKAYKEGYLPTDKFGIFEKKGVKYEYDIKEKEFIYCNEDEDLSVNFDANGNLLKPTIANTYYAAEKLKLGAFIYKISEF